ncbi:hypothetical protein D9Q98_005343 [Chlorella vulgaris]|uniref:Uncharacterized protein n=1 Tax=Chlorella vulgaris TaxID=3077 RepID=A0A9D4YVU5_CHLVU|nr:hypothetical protein D9Q98_005343 [Chlorella vulgaris]
MRPCTSVRRPPSFAAAPFWLTSSVPQLAGLNGGNGRLAVLSRCSQTAPSKLQSRHSNTALGILCCQVDGMLTACPDRRWRLSRTYFNQCATDGTRCRCSGRRLTSNTGSARRRGVASATITGPAASGGYEGGAASGSQGAGPPAGPPPPPTSPPPPPSVGPSPQWATQLQLLAAPLATVVVPAVGACLWINGELRKLEGSQKDSAAKLDASHRESAAMLRGCITALQTNLEGRMDLKFAEVARQLDKQDVMARQLDKLDDRLDKLDAKLDGKRDGKLDLKLALVTGTMLAGFYFLPRK